jgi:CBS domain-containing protein
MKVKDIMSKDVKYVATNTSLREAAEIMREKNIGVLPVGADDRLMGMLTDRDIVVRAIANDKNISTVTVKDVMTPSVLYCFEEDTIEDVAQNMAKNQVRRLPVLNAEKRLVGIVSLSDLCCKGSKQAASETLQSISHTCCR